MEPIRQRLRNPWMAALLGFVAGLLLGLPILGWWLWPVQFTDATPAQLRNDLKLDYLRSVIDSYGLTGDANTARTRFAGIGPRAAELLGLLQQDPQVDQARLRQFLGVVTDLIPTGGGKVTPPASVTAPVTPGPSRTLVLGLLGLCLVTLVLGALLVFFLRMRRRSRTAEAPSAGEPAPVAQPAGDTLAEGSEVVEEEGKGAPQATAPATAPAAAPGPLERFVTTYVLGDDLYEDSFTINSAAGEFLGECGVGISEQVGVGEPKKVTAFEVWLFDKRDTRTSTFVLMSNYAMNKDDVRTRLAPRGTPLEAVVGTEFWMETQSLRTRVQVREVQYGRGALPPNSFIERLTLQLEVWLKA